MVTCSSCGATLSAIQVASAQNVKVPGTTTVLTLCETCASLKEGAKER